MPVLDPMTATAESKNKEDNTKQEPKKATVLSPQYEDTAKKEDSPLGKVKAGLAGDGDVSVDPASVKPATFKASIDLASINEAIIGMSQLVDNAQDFMFRTIKPELMDPSELASAMNNPNLKEFAQQAYEIEKQKFDASQAMGRNIAMSLIGQIFASASGTKGEAVTTGMDTFKAGADTIQANQNAIDAQNNLIDKANQDATAAMNKNFLEYVKDYNKYETDIVKAKNQMIYKTYENNVKTIKDLLGKKANLDKELIKGATQGMKEREANKRKEQEINADMSIANLDAQTKIAVKNLDSRTKIAIANQVDRIARYRVAVEAERLDRDEKNASQMVFKDAYKTVAETMGALNVNPVLTLNAMKDLDMVSVSEWADTDSVSMAGFIDALERRMDSSWTGRPQITGGVFGKTWDTDGAAFINASMILTNGGFTVSKEGWKVLGSELTNEDLNSITVAERVINGQKKLVVLGTDNLSEKIDDLMKNGHIDARIFKDGRDKDARIAQWAVGLGTNIKYNLLMKTKTEQ